MERINLNLRNNFVVIMAGYTGVGKSTIAKKIAKIPNTKIFHSAFVRKELNLTPKTKEESDKFFDYRNNLRFEVDKKVYSTLAENTESSLVDNNVVLDAGFFFSWQRELVYEKIKSFSPEVFILKVTCEDEKEIRKRLKEREEKFDECPLNETPSWNTYIATKMITEHFDKDVFPQSLKVNILEYDTLKKEVKIVKEDINSQNTNKIINALKEGINSFIQDENFNLVEGNDETINDLIKNKFIIALDFDGVITDPYKLKVNHINNLGYNIKEGECSGGACFALGVKKEDYDYGSIKAYTESPDVLPLEQDFLENYLKIRESEGIAVFIVTSRYSSMIHHLQEFLKSHKIRIEGVINTNKKSKIEALRKIKANIFVEDSLDELNQILEGEIHSDVCDLILYRNEQNKFGKIDNGKVMEVHNWKDVLEKINLGHNKFINKNK